MRRLLFRTLLWIEATGGILVAILALIVVLAQTHSNLQVFPEHTWKEKLAGICVRGLFYLMPGLLFAVGACIDAIKRKLWARVLMIGSAGWYWLFMFIGGFWGIAGLWSYKYIYDMPGEQLLLMAGISLVALLGAVCEPVSSKLQ